MKNSDEFFLELKDSVSIMDLYTEEPCDAHFHFHEDYEIYLFQGGDVDFYICLLYTSQKFSFVSTLESIGVPS